jgi:DNA topoisomerase-1
MEEHLDAISSGGENWHTVLENFWTDFSKNVTEIAPLRITEVIDYLESHIGPTLFQSYPDHKCPDCDAGEVHLKLSKFGAFIGCSRYPDCTYTKNIKELMGTDDGETKPVFEKVPDRTLGNNEGIIFTLKKGPYGFYIQCQKEKPTKKDKPKNLKLPSFVEPDNATLQQAVFLYSLPHSVGSLKGEPITLNIGRFGPFLKWKTTNASLPKGTNFFELSEADAQQLIEKKIG